MADTRGVFRNSALRLVVEYEEQDIEARGKVLTDELAARFLLFQPKLFEQIGLLLSNFPNYKLFGGRLIAWVKMQNDAYSVTKTPNDLFLTSENISIRAPWRDGYLIEVTEIGLVEVARRIRDAANDKIKFDVANINAIRYFPDALVELCDPTGADGEGLLSIDAFKLFRVQTPSYSTQAATAGILKHISDYIRSGSSQLLSSIAPQHLIEAESSDMITAGTRSPHQALLDIEHSVEVLSKLPARENGQFTLLLGFKGTDDLKRLMLSGSVVRWEPISRFAPTPPGEGEEPPLEINVTEHDPTVAVIDGGYHANRYRCAVAWESPKVIPDQSADRAHGNKVCSIVVDAHAWNNHLPLPELHCRLGIVQAIPKRSSSEVVTIESIAQALDEAMEAHPDTMVWNLSANLDHPASSFDVSQGGHLLAQVARKHNRLLVISAGNKPENSVGTIAPPADCEAALVVAGRMPALLNEPGDPCPISRTAYGPDYMTKPDLSWYSKQRVLGGRYEAGTSYAAPLISRLAAHCFKNVENPTPDLVRALMINAADLQQYCPNRGFGTPDAEGRPWLSTDASVILAWTETIKAQKRNYWNAIAVPPSMIKNGRLVGRIKLVSILRPRVQRRGDKYIATRFEANIQSHHKGAWTKSNILDPLESKTLERVARAKYAKWQPTRCFEAVFTEKNGPYIDPDKPFLRIGGRVYWRHKYIFDPVGIRDEMHEVSFALTLESSDLRSDTYNEFRQLMADNVVELVSTIEEEVTTGE